MPSSDDGQASEPQCIRRIWQIEWFMYGSLTVIGILLIIGKLFFIFELFQ